LRPLLVLGALPVACLAAAGPALVELLYDPRYEEAGWMLQILAVGAWFQIPQASSGSAVLALGQPRALALSNGAKFVGLVVFLPLGYASFGVPGAIAGVAAAELIRYLSLALAMRSAKLPGLASDLAMTVVAAGLAAAGLLADRAVGESGGGAGARLVVAVAAIAGLWLPISLFVLRAELPRLRELLAARRRRTGLSGVPS
jgi:O-antigen/teichoic acid export membrane protein